MTDLVIHAGYVFTAAERDPLLKDAWVRVQDGRIVEVTSSEPQPAHAATRVDAPNATLLPGLIDCHVHFAVSGGADWLSEVKESLRPELLAGRRPRAQNAPGRIHHGSHAWRPRWC